MACEFVERMGQPPEFARCDGSGMATFLDGSMTRCAVCGNDVGTDEFGDASEHDRVLIYEPKCYHCGRYYSEHDTGEADDGK